MNAETVSQVIAAIPVVALVIGACARAWEWLAGPGAVKRQLDRRAAWLEVVERLEILGENERATSLGDLADKELARWLAQKEADEKRPGRLIAMAVAVPFALTFALALLLSNVVSDQSGKRLFALIALASGLVLVSAGAFLAVTYARYREELDEAARRRPIWPTDASNESE